MQVTSIKTHKITSGEDLLEIIDRYLGFSQDVIPAKAGISSGEGDPRLREDDKEKDKNDKIILTEGSVLAVTSKIVSVTEGRIVPMTSVDKDELIKQESQYYLPRNLSRYDVSFTITHHILAPSAGVDESNGDGNYVLWPKDAQQSANMIREHISQKFGLKNFGVIITDSKTTPLRWGVTGTVLAHSGFAAIKDYIGQNDLFGRPFVYEKLHIADSLAASAAFVMGEGAEQTPMAIITDIPQVEFQHRNPTQEELNSLIIAKEDDLYAPLLTSVEWEKGKKE
jgi:F420-0:gamma-glutamyl ligase